MAKTIALTVFTAQAGAAALFGTLQSALIDRMVVSAALAIGTSSKKKVKLVAAPYAFVNGSLVKGTINEEETIAGTITNAMFNVFVIMIDALGVVTTAAGTQGATLATVVMPTILANVAVLGFVIVNPTGTGNFVAGTTDLDDATVVPNAVYVNTFGFNANVLSL